MAHHERYYWTPAISFESKMENEEMLYFLGSSNSTQFGIFSCKKAIAGVKIGSPKMESPIAKPIPLYTIKPVTKKEPTNRGSNTPSMRRNESLEKGGVGEIALRLC